MELAIDASCDASCCDPGLLSVFTVSPAVILTLSQHQPTEAAAINVNNSRAQSLQTELITIPLDVFAVLLNLTATAHDESILAVDGRPIGLVRRSVGLHRL